MPELRQQIEASLEEVTVLALDCQTTGARPEKGGLLEIGWARGRAVSCPESTDVRSHLIRSSRDIEIPAAIRRLTGISAADLRHCVSATAAWRDLMSAVDAVAAGANRSGVCPTVIHFARFENPFLRRLHEIEARDRIFPFQIICTHAIARRLLPELPRRGIRALAGYFGHGMPEQKRSGDHVLATLCIWKNLVALLASRCRVTTLRGLEDWLANTPPPGASKRMFPLPSERRRHLPDGPGIYRLRRSNRDILYIGKAKSLRRRVNSYFRSRAAHSDHILEMLTQARDLDCATTVSALEAAVAESDEIKRHSPPYNVALRSEGRSLVYLTRDLRHSSSRCDDAFGIGPLPASRSIGVLRFFAEWLNRDMRLHAGVAAAIEAAGRDFWPAQRPTGDCLKKGLDLFCREHRKRLRHPSALRFVTSLGAFLWRRRALAPAGRQPESDDTGAPAPKQSVTDTAAESPKDTAETIEAMLMHAAHMLRRACWLHLLSDCCLAWGSPDEPATVSRLLVFQKGRVTACDSLRPGTAVPAPRRCGRPSSKRRRAMDLATYDRLRVVTTEMRRLAGEGRAIELRLSNERRLALGEVKKYLDWV
jgi:DNA polymerase-3 subunit epsilon